MFREKIFNIFFFIYIYFCFIWSPVPIDTKNNLYEQVRLSQSHTRINTLNDFVSLSSLVILVFFQNYTFPLPNRITARTSRTKLTNHRHSQKSCQIFQT